MPTDIERLTVLMEANTKQFANSIKKIERDVDKTFAKGSRGVRQFDLSLGKAAATARTLAGAFGVGFIAGGLSQLPATLRQVTAEASKLVDTADKVGLTTDALQELRFAAEQTGVASSQLDIAMQRFSRRLAEAAAGTGVLKDVLTANNIALRDQDGRIRPTIDLLGDYANLIRGAASDQDKLRLAFLAFDTEGAALVNTLRGGSDGLDGLRKSARDASAVIDAELLRSAKDLDDKFNALSTTIGVRFKSAVLTGLTAATDALTDFETTAQRVGNSSIWVKLGTLFGADIKPGIVPFPGSAGQGAGMIKPEGGRPPQEQWTKPTIIPKPEDPEAMKKAAAIKRVVDQLKLEAEQLGRTAEAQELYNRLHAAGTKLDTAAGQQIASLVGSIQEQERALRAVGEAQDYLGQAALTAFDAMVLGGEKATDVIAGLLVQLAKAAAQAAFLGQGPLAGLFGTAQSSGLIGSLFSAAGFGGARAAGGPVSAGRSYLVGEQGPELFTPRTGGRILANGSTGGTTIVVQNSYNSGITPTDRAWIEAMQARSAVATRKAVQQDIRRGQSGRSDAILARGTA